MRLGRVLSLFAALAAGALASAPAPARADRIAEAEDLFRRAKALVNAGKHAEACPLFAESHRLDAGVGTLLNLALCHEEVGKVASAWGELRAVEQQARATNPERAQLAREHADRLEPRLSRIAIVVTEAARRTPGLVVRVDGEEKAAPLWAGVPVDPGAHVVEASAPGKKSVTLPAKVDDEAIVVRVEVPPLADVPREVSAAADADREEHLAALRARRTAGYVVSGAGLAVLAAGGAFGVAAVIGDGQAREACPEPCVRGSAEAERADETTSRALTFANVANVTIPVGALATLVGGYLVLTASPSRATSGPVVRASVAGNGISLSGSF